MTAIINFAEHHQKPDLDMVVGDIVADQIKEGRR
jgi:hypothetical protein